MKAPDKIITISEFALVIGVDPKKFGYYVYRKSISSQYSSFKIKKRGGGERQIFAPKTNLSFIQRRIARFLVEIRQINSSAHGYVSKRSIKTNATPHVAARHILNIDLQDFFGAINFGRVFGMLMAQPYCMTKSVAAGIAKACTVNNVLPKGAPSSPVISNLICAKLDSQLRRFARENKCAYTRYSDDITFSTTQRSMPLAVEIDGVIRLSPQLESIILENGFNINKEKVKLRSREIRQEVTGLVVNKKVNVRRKYVRNVRAMLNALEKHGRDKATAFATEKFGISGDFEFHLRGKIQYIRHIRGYTDELAFKLAKKFNSIAEEPIKLKLIGRDLWEQAVWVFESGTAQGTCFFLDGYGVVTNNHNVEDLSDCITYHPSDHSKKFKLDLIKHDAFWDLASFECPAGLAHIQPLKVRANPPSNAMKITVAGYPQHSFAKPIVPLEGKFLRTFSENGLIWHEVDARISGGISGGPILDVNSQVLAVATRGDNGDGRGPYLFLGVPIEKVRECLTPPPSAGAAAGRGAG